MVQFGLEVIFADSPNKKSLQIDLTSAESYVLDHRYFGQLTRREQDFDPTKSPTFTEVNNNFSKAYFRPYDKQDIAVGGIVGKDKFNFIFEDIEGEFAVINKTDNNKVVQGLDGRYYTGRIGFSRAETNVADLRNAIFASHVNHSLCMYVSPRLDRRGAIVSVSVGDESYGKGSEFITKFDAESNDQGHWQVPVTSIKIARYVYQAHFPGILSTTTDKIGVPAPVFNGLVRAMNATFDREVNSYVLQCIDEFPDPLRINVNFKELEIRFDSYTKRVVDKCVLNMIPLKERVVILGAPFFNEHVICLDFINETVTLFYVPPFDY
ncbi:unnamed protein product [Bursaphelenchus xylophilus]|uniref:(pine wood nematode) hypothetical protein n=1 Tax=Bursaphelenchus xylophilus TaxID=6326 RepID=A0A1I7SR21_BURXY|nr:unnamed protein product [Bursaphelenchus xylophilus]CAG9110714.1 unnamed protein product [Bursaphelenchus xylophilus]